MCDLHRSADAAARPKTITDLVDELVVAVTNGRIYNPTHPRVTSTLESLVEVLEDLYAERGSGTIQLGAADGYLFYERRPLLGASLAAAKLLDPLRKIQAGGIAMDQGARLGDFAALMQALGRESKHLSSAEEGNRFLEAEGCTRLRFLPPYSRGGQSRLPGVDGSDIPPPPVPGEGADSSGADGAAATPVLSVPAHLYQSVVNTLQDMMVKAARGDSLDFDETHTFVERAVEQLDAAPHELLRLSRYERYDAFTFGHSIRVGLLAINFARTITQDPDFLFRIGIAALMHDIGKAKVPFEILHSTGRLDQEQRAQMNRHTEHGGRILLDMDGSEPMAIAAALGHHRTIDGGGYPQTLHQVQLSTCTRMVKICDVYEALTAVRPYKDRMSPTRAYRIMMSMSDHFDQALLKWFIYINGIYPVGSMVRLTSGEIAVVTGRTQSLKYPQVELEKNTTRAGTRLDLNEQSGSEILSIDDMIYEDD